MAIALVVLASVVGLGLARGPVATAQGDQQLTSLVSGPCDDPRDVVVRLNPLRTREGGIIASFTTVDREIGELTGGDYSIVIGQQGAPLACGELSGQSGDVYASLRQMNGSNLSGIVWLHARESQTQVTVFVGEGLTGGESTDSGNSSGPPEPPAEQTPEPSGATTSQNSGTTETYTAPTYGYSVSYDTGYWAVDSDTTEPTDLGPLDYLALVNSSQTTMAEFMGLKPEKPMTAQTHIGNLVRGMLSDKQFSEAKIRQDADGNPIQGGGGNSAYAAIDVTWTDGSGYSTFYARNWVVSDDAGIAMMVFQANTSDYENQMSRIHALEDGVVIP